MRSKPRLVLSVAAVAVVLDQLSKRLVQDSMYLHESVPVIKGLFHLTYVRNTGGAFGVLAGGSAAFRLPFFIAISLVAVAVLGWFVYRVPENRPALVAACGAVLGGALGNLIDRIAFGEVIDFLDLFYRSYHWPTFNLADSFITLGVAVMVFDAISTRDLRKVTDGT